MGAVVQTFVPDPSGDSFAQGRGMSAPDLPPLPRTAVIGLGQMGRGIARRLEAAGSLAGACDPSDSAIAAARLRPGIHRTSVAGLAPLADILLFVVPATSDIRTAIADAPLRHGQIVVDLTTSDPTESRMLAASLDRIGVCYLDAAMTGGAAAADTGQLTLMAGGAAGVLARARPALDQIATTIIHLGPVGTGHAMKLVHNMILHTIFLATCEGLRLAERAGIAPATAVEVLNAGNARSFVSEVRFPRDILSGTMQTRSRISNLSKDLGLAVDWAEGLAAQTPFGRLTCDVLTQAMAMGMEDTDFAHLFPQYDALVTRLEPGE
jgi:3-hydroxyisobutyrate dehydrogenase